MPYTTKKSFEKYLDYCKIYRDVLNRIKPKHKVRYPSKDKEFGTCSRDIEEMVLKLQIDHENNGIRGGNKCLRQEKKWVKKNIEDLLKSKKESILGLIHYNKIHTYNWGKVNLKEFVNYLNMCINVHSDYDSNKLDELYSKIGKYTKKEN